VVLRFKPTLNPVLVPSVSPAVARPSTDYTFTASADRDTWAQVFVRTPGELRAVIACRSMSRQMRAHMR